MTRATSTDYRHPHRPWPVALANRLGGLAAGTGLGADWPTPDALMRKAARRAGCAAWRDPAFEARLGLLLRSLAEEAQLHPTGRFMAVENLIRIAVNRLRLEAHWTASPEVLAPTLARPVFVVGQQRTGTTMLHRLLAADPAFRFLASWEALSPAPPAPPRSALGRLSAGLARGTDPRVRLARLAQRSLAYLAPDFFAIHPVDALGPEEDCLLFDFDLFSTVPEATWRVPAFSAWLEAQDHRPAYAFYAQVLKTLTAQAPAGRWVLKTPQHLEHLEALVATFPDARIIWTHRDPNKTVASFCSMMAHAWGVFSDRVDPLQVAGHWVRKVRYMVERAMAARERLGEERFLDVHYMDLVADPMAQMKRVYDFLEQDLGPEAEANMRAWRSRNPQHRYGRHRYDLADFGLDEDRVEALYADYRARFGVAREA